MGWRTSLLLFSLTWIACAKCPVAQAPDAPKGTAPRSGDVRSPSAPRGSAAAPSPAAGQTAVHVVFVSIDGLGATTIANRDALGLRIPELRRLLSEGASASSVLPVYPSLTYPNHTTMMTGVSPRAHGIYNNFAFDPLDKNKDGWTWYTRDVKAELLWDAVHRAGKKVGSVYFPVTVGANIDWNIPQFWRAEVPEDSKLLRALSTPETVLDLEAHQVPLPGEHTKDSVRADAAIRIWEAHEPDLLLVYFSDFDTAAHKFGPASREAKDALEAIDASLGKLRSSVETKRVPFVLAVASDHGFRAATKSIRLGVMLKKEGLVEFDAKGIKRYDAAVWRGNGMCAVYLGEDIDDKAKRAVAAAFERIARSPANGIGRIVTAPELEDLGAFPGAAFALEAAPGFMFNKGFSGPLVAPSEERGAHGYDPSAADMRAVFMMAGQGVRGGSLGEVRMTDIAPTLASFLGVTLRAAQGRVLSAAPHGTKPL